MSAARDKLLTASDLAALCEVDLKTIHNWVDRGVIPHFRTPGRHLRFRPAEVAEFLRAYGYSVPRELARAEARRALVVGSLDTLALAQAAAPSLTIAHAPHPLDALVALGADAPDVLLLDARAIAAHVDLTAFLQAAARAVDASSLIVIVDPSDASPSVGSPIARDAAAIAGALNAAGENVVRRSA